MVRSRTTWPARVLRLWACYVARNDARTKAMVVDALLRDVRWRPHGQNEAYVNRIVTPLDSMPTG
jgi:hypothetical protein